MDENDIYREEILEHYRHPMNFGTLKKPSHSASSTNPLCGDRMTLQIRVDLKGVVREVAFEGSGCALSIASASLFTEWMRGKNFQRLKKVGESQIQKLLKASIRPSTGESADFVAWPADHQLVGPARLYCALLPYTALKKLF